MLNDRNGGPGTGCLEKPWRRRDLWTLVAPLLASPFAMAGFAMAQDEPAGRVGEVRGNAAAQRGNQRRELALHDRVWLGEWLSTDEQSRMTLRLAQNITLMLGALTRLRLDARRVGAVTTIHLAGGALLYDHRADGLGGEARIESPYGLIEVRGTRFFAGPSEDVFGVFVAEGVVDVTAAGRTVTLQRGQGTDIAALGEPPDRPREWSARRIRWAFASVR